MMHQPCEKEEKPCHDLIVPFKKIKNNLPLVHNHKSKQEIFFFFFEKRENYLHSNFILKIILFTLFNFIKKTIIHHNFCFNNGPPSTVWIEANVSLRPIHDPTIEFPQKKRQQKQLQLWQLEFKRRHYPLISPFF